ncbi:MAG: biosynthetic arginine decarboxylase, partial [Planctomycetota bacterium]
MSQRERHKIKASAVLSNWSIDEANELYSIDRWGAGLFSVKPDGCLYLDGDTGTADVNLKALVDEIRLRGLEPPVLIRFTDILARRMHAIGQAFHDAFAEHDYHGQFRGVYPIKVNQHRHVLEDIVAGGKPYHFGLECGSKPELLIAMAMHDDPESVIVCNGFKDRDYVETALQARRLGLNIFLVIEKPVELHLILNVARRMKVEPLIGLRMKLASRGKGLWETSGGDKSKFGLRCDEIVEVVRTLRKRRMLKQLQLLHFHIGSQISDIHRIKGALKEASGFFTEICRMGAPIGYADVGGGMAVDYDGSHTNFASSSNYDVREYAADVVDAFSTACNEADLPHPTIITESGRAMVAHHAILVVEALATSRQCSDMDMPRVPRKAPEIVTRMVEMLEGFSGKNFQEVYHDAIDARQEALLLFNLRQLSLEHRAITEKVFWILCRRILDYVEKLDYFPDELQPLQRLMCTTYYCNFSIFQSLPDHWAIKQIFPVVPLHRLNEEPSRQGVLADITCDSDGVMNQFADLRDVKQTLPLHPVAEDDPYYLGIFLVGAYQEILGDLHNLFGDTNVVHVSMGPEGYVIDKTIEGNSIAEVLDYVAFNRRDILSRLRERVEDALRRGQATLEQSAPFIKRMEQQLDDTTYLKAERTPRKSDGST